jgi:hypothetical protein
MPPKHTTRRGRLVGLAILVLTVPLLAQATDDRGYTWSAAGTTLQHGRPETDDRDARFDCDHASGVRFTLPLWTTLPPGGVPIAVTQSGETEMFVGRREDGGDGEVVSARIKGNSLLLRSLAHGRSVRLVSGHLDRPLAGIGAAEPVAQFVAACRNIGVPISFR